MPLTEGSPSLAVPVTVDQDRPPVSERKTAPILLLPAAASSGALPAKLLDREPLACGGQIRERDGLAKLATQLVELGHATHYRTTFA